MTQPSFTELDDELFHGCHADTVGSGPNDEY